MCHWRAEGGCSPLTSSSFPPAAITLRRCSQRLLASIRSSL
ncbi:UNVERIFIED_CONTAM: hypothetical protein GTU68_000707 [Idotea baltica]|nr:hypothetical protein [Idotea baltica]